MENKEQILAKIDELRNLINNEDKDQQKTLVDFFKPTLEKLRGILITSIEINLTKKDILSPKVINEIIVELEDTIIIPSNEVLSVLPNIEGDKVESLIQSYIINNELLHAVKAYKDRTGLGLKECKEYVDSIRYKMILKRLI